MKDNAEIVDEAFKWVSRSLVQHISKAICDDFDTIKFDSPLEQIFWLWWHCAMTCRRAVGHTDAFRLVPQHWALNGRYRLDFIVQDDTAPTRLLAIELDGHDFHERTREQVAQRNQRDRDLQAEGWTVLHFSGSEFYADPLRCLKEIFDRVLG